MTRPAQPHSPVFIGIDLGTSGVRACAIDAVGNELATARRRFPPHTENQPAIWWQLTTAVLTELATSINPEQVVAMSVDATSATVLLIDENGAPVSPVLMYRDQCAQPQAALIQQFAPDSSVTLNPGSGLAKVMRLITDGYNQKARYLTHQCDWIIGKLTQRWGISDPNNSLKTGYDPVTHTWPEWIAKSGIPEAWFPEIIPPTEPVATLAPTSAKEINLPPHVIVYSGTTDSTAACIATGAHQLGDAITSLGSSLVLKVIGQTPVASAEYGIYSQPLGDQWLIGGASNSGGAVLAQFFSAEQIQQLSRDVNPEQPTTLDYYPLVSPGERFPIADPALSPRVSPRPADDVMFFQGLLEGMAQIEQQGYMRLQQCGAPYPTRVLTVGGGAKNSAWTAIRMKKLGVPVTVAQHTEAAYGAALSARTGYMRQKESGNE